VATGLAAALLSARDATQLSTVLAVVTALVVIAVPGAGLLVIAVACPISQTSFGATLVTEKDLIVLLIASLLSHIAAGRSFRPKAWTVALSASAVCYFLVSGTLAGGGGSSGQNWRYVMMLGVPLLVLPVIAGNDVLTRRAVIAFGFSTACLAVAEALKSHASLTAAGSASAAGSALAAANNTGAVNHNAEGAIFVLALAGLLARFPHARRAAEKLALAAAITALVIGIAYSFSRSAYFGALAVITLFAARRSIRGLACAAVAVGCLVLVLPTAVGARLGSVWGSSGLDVSSALRLDLWSSALRMFEAHPVFGVGYLNFAAQLPGYYINSGSYDTFVIQFSLLDFAHNTYLTVLAETGLVGVVLVGALIAIGSHRAWVAARHGSWTGEGALLGLVGVGICSAFGEVLLVSPILASFLLTVLAADRTRGGSRDAIPPVAASAERT
jgi:O-antigen ligase